MRIILNYEFLLRRKTNRHCYQIYSITIWLYNFLKTECILEAVFKKKRLKLRTTGKIHVTCMALESRTNVRNFILHILFSDH